MEAWEGAAASRMRAWSPRAVIAIMRGISTHVRRAANAARHQQVPFFDLPFPVRPADEAAYVAGLASLVAQFQTQGTVFAS